MKSIKPGRGPSMMGGIAGIFMIGFGILWTVITAQGSGIFALFGVLWTGIAVVMTVYNFRNATGKNRYSQFDITEGDEEPDPLNERFGESREPEKAGEESDSRFCPYCGTPVHKDFSYCNSCGKKLL
ncbi:MAG: zinc ribbon domain-containing protein [Clostridia bacterium]|nr:zinc ribbon domain-containing protein [Clostridia bacterium]